MTKLERATRRAIREWCEDQGYTVKKIHHIIPRAYVVALARTAIRNLIVAIPPCDAPDLSLEGDLGSMTMLHFNRNLKVGDWCSVAYVVTETWGGWVAIPAVVVEN